MLLVVGVDAPPFDPHVARALELQIGKARIAVGLDQVDRIIETACARIPMAHPLVRGIGFDGARPIVCVLLSAKPAATSSTVTAVLLVGDGPVVWALCADQVHGVVPLVGRSTVTDPRLPRWLFRVRTADGRVLASLDPARMILDIGGPS